MNDMNKQMHYVLYHADETDVSVNAVVQNESIWVTQKAMADLFDCTSDNISQHLKNIYAEGELEKEATTEIFSVVQKEGKEKAESEYDGFNKTQKINSDFDRVVSGMLKRAKGENKNA